MEKHTKVCYKRTEVRYNAREVHYFCVKMVKNNEKNEQNMCRMYMKYVESMCILYKKQCKRCSKKHAKREIMLHYCAK